MSLSTAYTTFPTGTAEAAESGRWTWSVLGGLAGAGKCGGRSVGTHPWLCPPRPCTCSHLLLCPPPSPQASALAQTLNPCHQQQPHSLPRLPTHTPVSSSLLKGSPAYHGVLIPQPAPKAAPGMASSTMTVCQLRARAGNHVLTGWAGEAPAPAPTAHILVSGEACCFNQMEQPLFLIIALWAPSQAAFTLQDPAPRQFSLSSDNTKRENVPCAPSWKLEVQAVCESDLDKAPVYHFLRKEAVCCPLLALARPPSPRRSLLRFRPVN